VRVLVNGVPAERVLTYIINESIFLQKRGWLRCFEWARARSDSALGLPACATYWLRTREDSLWADSVVRSRPD